MTDASPPSRTASTGPRHRPRTVLTAALAGVLVLATVIGGGWLLSAERRSTSGAENRIAITPPDDGWANGAAVNWRTSIGTNQEIVTAGNHLIAIDRSTAKDTNATLTGYTVGDEGATESWTQTVDLSRGAPSNPEFLPWGESTLVHGTTLIDLNTGGTSTAPWNAQSSPVLADDIIITCDSNDSCQAWREGNAEPLWSAQVPGGSNQPKLSSLLATPVRRDSRYIIMNMRHIINLDTGQEVQLELPALTDYSIAAASDGWVVAALENEGTTGDHTLNITHIYEFDIDGGALTNSYAAKSGVRDRGKAFIYKTSPRPQSAYQALWRDGDFNTILAFGQGDENCVTSIEVLDGPTFNVPQAGATGPISPSSSQAGCPDGSNFAPSPGHRVLLTVAKSRIGTSSFHFLYNLATGEAVSFKGINTTGNSQLELVRPNLILGYDPDDGEVYGFSPASSR